MDRTNHRRTALHLAVVKKQAPVVAALIDLGADLNAEDAVGLTALDQAALGSALEIARLLLDAGARMTLPAAIALERPDDVERLIQEDPDALSTTNNRRWAQAPRTRQRPCLRRHGRFVASHDHAPSLGSVDRQHAGR